MRKLKLESLQVESFATTGLTPPSRGTVEANADVDTRRCPGGTGPSYCVLCYATQDVRQCAETEYVDCTVGCTQANSCNVCWVDKTKGCEID
jgi:hypothetical protein